MSKIRNLTIYEIISSLKRFMAGTLVFVMLGNSGLAKSEGNKLEGNNDIKISDELKGNPNELTKEEKQIQEVSGEIVQEENKLGQYDLEEYLEKSANSKKNLSELKKIVGLSSREMNDMLNTVNIMRSIDIQKELRENEDLEWTFPITKDYESSLNESVFAFVSLCDAAVKNPKKAETILELLFEEEDKEKIKDVFLKFEAVQEKLDRLKETSIDEVRELLDDLASEVPDLSNTPTEYYIKLSHLPIYYLITSALWTRVECYVRMRKKMDNATYIEWKNVKSEVEETMYKLRAFVYEVIRVYIEDEVSLGAK